MVAQLKQLKAEDILEKAMELIPQVRLDSGLPPLVTPTSQIVGAQAVNCALDIRNGKAMYSNTSNQFVALVKGEYGKTPFHVDPEFRFKIAGVREETPYDTSKYKMQPNPDVEGCPGVKLAENEKEVLLLELFPMVAKDYLTKFKKAKCAAIAAAGATAEKTVQLSAVKEAVKEEPATNQAPVKGMTIDSPMPGKIFKLNVAVGDKVAIGQEVIILEAMKMENNIMSAVSGTVKRIFVAVGDNVADGQHMIEIE
ncbi:MAG: biotin/lipoyl-containing protein, partial [Rikenellaceae bacterium]